ncbi:MAG: S9 family peptidase [Fimbriimonadaceae bacterium]|nr:S9 family peptidase [Fimbriimonadaceae bacterium]
MHRSIGFGLILLSSLGLAQPLPTPSNGLTISRLQSYPLIHGRSPSGAQMSPDGTKIVFGWNKTGERRLDVYVMDYPSGNTRMVVEADQIARPPRQEDSRTEEQKKNEELYDGGIGGFQWAPDSKEIMFSYRGRTWLMAADGSNRRPIFDTNEAVSNATYSPDGRYIAFMRNGNLFRWERRTGGLKQLTYVSGAGSVDGFEWSPDDRYLAVTWSDNSKMGGHVMMDFTKQRAEVVQIQRMWNGDRPVNNQIGFVPAEGGQIKFIQGLPRYMWVTDMEWSPDSRYLAISWHSEDFKEHHYSIATPSMTYKWDAYEEKAPSNYIPDFRMVAWSRDNRLLFTTDILDGKWAYRSVLSCTPHGADLKRVYAKDHDVVWFGRPKDSDRILLVTMKRGGNITELTTLEPNGSSKEYSVYDEGVITPVEFDQTAGPLVSDDGTKMVTSASAPGKPWDLFALEPSQRRLTNSQPEEFKKIEWAPVKRVSFPGPDGRMIGATLTLPKGYRAGQRYPMVISNMYANSAKMSWGGYVDNFMATELGMVVMSIDFRASWGYGGEFNSGYYGSMGIIDTQEAIKAKEWAVAEGYANPDRCAVWGWSYGGFLTCMIMETGKGAFDTGVAVASVTDWRQYNEWYTRRRLGMVADDAEVFKKTSPVTYASGLSGNLLLVHGVLDDNVLFQDTVQLIDQFQRADKHFDLAIYPRADHGIGKIEERGHVFEEITRYLYWKLNRPADMPAVQPYVPETTPTEG